MLAIRPLAEDPSFCEDCPEAVRRRMMPKAVLSLPADVALSARMNEE